MSDEVCAAVCCVCVFANQVASKYSFHSATFSAASCPNRCLHRSCCCCWCRSCCCAKSCWCCSSRAVSRYMVAMGGAGGLAGRARGTGELLPGASELDALLDESDPSELLLCLRGAAEAWASDEDECFFAAGIDALGPDALDDEVVDEEDEGGSAWGPEKSLLD